jgi:uncharacterized protein (TIGR00255 family)
MRSMTGFGAGSADVPGARIAVEVRGVNQRHLDIRIAAPREYAAWEGELRDRVRAQVARGRVDITIVRTPVASRRQYRVAAREELAAAYVDAAQTLARRLRLAGKVGLADVLRLPELFEVVERPPDPGKELPGLRRALAAALRAFVRERTREGRHVQRDMCRRAGTLASLAGRIRRRLPELQRALQRRMEDRLARLGAGGGVDQARLAQELAALADRGDVTEELVRLESHLAALAAALRGRAPAGKQVEFLLQEILRELNTTGAKAADVQTSAWVLEAKGEVEKLREQVQNVE